MKKIADKNIEQQAADTLLLDNGVSLKIGGKEFIITQTYLGALYHLARLYSKMVLDESKMTGEHLMLESKRLYHYAPIAAEVVAVAILNKRMLASKGSFAWIRLQFEIKSLKRFILKNMTPADLRKASDLIIFTLNNPVDFINSIRSMSGSRMTTSKATLSPEENGG